MYRGADNKWYLADADDATKMPVLGITLHAIASGAKGQVLINGYLADTAWAWTVGGPSAVIYASATPGELTQTPPALVRVIGTAYSATSIMFNPSGLSGLGGDDPETEADYIIWTDGTNYYAKNGHDGSIEFTGASVAAVVALIVAAYPTFDGVIYDKTTGYVSGYISGTRHRYEPAREHIGYPADYVIWVEGATYYAKNGHTGQVTNNAVFSTLFNGLMTANTSFYLKDGTYTATANVLIDEDYVVVTGGKGAKIIASAATAWANGPLFSITGDYCLIENLIFDGNYPTISSVGQVITIGAGAMGNVLDSCVIQNGAQYGLNVYHGHKITISNCEAHTLQYGFEVGGNPGIYSEEVTFIGNHAWDCSNCGFKIRGVKGVIVSGNTVDVYSPTVGTTICDGIRIYMADYPVWDCIVIGNHVIDSAGTGTNSGIRVDGDATATAYSILIDSNTIENCYYAIVSLHYNVQITNNIIKTTRYCGIRISGEKTIVRGNHLEGSGIQIYGTNATHPTDSLIENNFITGGNQYYRIVGDGIAITGEGGTATIDDVKIKNNYIHTVTGYGINLYVAAGYTPPTNILIEGNNLESCTSGNINIGAGSTLAIRRNTGYVTESSGTASIPMDGASTYVVVPHRLSVTPTQIDTQPKEAAGINQYVPSANIDATNFRIYIPVAVAASAIAVTKAVADDGGVQTNETTPANNATANDMTLLPAVPAANDAYYFGGAQTFGGVRVNIGTQGVGVWTAAWEFWNGTAWTALAGVVDGTVAFTAAAGAHDVTFTIPTTWATTTVNTTLAYYVRCRVATYTSVVTSPLGTQSWLLDALHYFWRSVSGNGN